MKFEVSPEFKMFQAQTQTAFQEAGQQEHGASMGCDLPVGTRGKATISGGIASAGKPKVVNGQPQPAKPYFLIEIEIVEPASHKGRKYNRYFDISHHEKYTTAQKIADWWDWMEDAGCPNEVRKTGDPAQGFNWAGQEARYFDFIIEAGYQGRGQIKSVPAMGQLPSATSTNQALGQPVQFGPAQVQAPAGAFHAAPAPAQPAPAAPAPVAAQPTPAPSGFQVGQEVTAFNQKWTVLEVSGETCKLKNVASGNEMPGIPLAAVSA